jgi:hypothetical protein
VKVLNMILPYMGNPQQARVFVDLNLKDKDPYTNGTKVSVKPEDGFGKDKVAKIIKVDKNDPDNFMVLYQEGGAKEMVKKENVTLLGAAAVSADTEKRRLQGMLGYAYYPIMGIPSGHYKLDMSKEMDQLCLKRLSAINNTETSFRRKEKNGDTSQKGNWMNFRNENFRGLPHCITPWFLDPVPKQGVLEFDYVSTTRPDEYVRTKEEPSLSKSRFLSMVYAAFDLPEKDEHGVLVNVEERAQEATAYDKLNKEVKYDWMHGLWTPCIRKAGDGRGKRDEQEKKFGDKFGNELAVLMGEITAEVVEVMEEKIKDHKSGKGDGLGLGGPGSRPGTRGDGVDASGGSKPGTPGSRPTSKGGDGGDMLGALGGSNNRLQVRQCERAGVHAAGVHE